MDDCCNVYSVYDRVALECGPLFLAVNDGVAVRNYKTLSMDHPEEYALVCLATFNKRTMIIIPETTPRYVEVSA